MKLQKGDIMLIKEFNKIKAVGVVYDKDIKNFK